MNKKELSRGIRNNNPGNIDFNPSAYARDPWVGELGKEQHPNARFTTFDTPVHGIRALCKILLTYHRHRKAADGSPIDTVQEIIDRWAPPSENDTDSYVAHVRDGMNVERGEEIDVDDPSTLAMLASYIIQHENGENPYSIADIFDAANMAIENKTYLENKISELDQEMEAVKENLEKLTWKKMEYMDKLRKLSV